MAPSTTTAYHTTVSCTELRPSGIRLHGFPLVLVLVIYNHSPIKSLHTCALEMRREKQLLSPFWSAISKVYQRYILQPETLTTSVRSNT